ncbi:zinc-binding oxidoreductase-like protein CipB [Cladochytrium replicatum]|nr:zinc-binding oxidoreductase-like protein CipB [Cladochytrium replicatum]
MPSSSKNHSAAFLPSKGSKLIIAERPTPLPGPDEVLIDVKAIALNPLDNASQSMGIAVKSYPAIIGSDIAGVILLKGDSVPNHLGLSIGKRVAAFAVAFFKQGAPDYGGFQRRVIVPYHYVFGLPDSISFKEGALLPMAVSTAFAGLYTAGLPLSTNHAPEDKKGFLLWGAAGSVGSATLQVAKSMGFYIYATASAKHHYHLKTLGAYRLFDYNDRNVINDIVNTAKADGVTIDIGYLAAGGISPCVSVIEKLRGDTSKQANLACAPPAFFELAWWWIFPTWRGISVKFVSPPSDQEELHKFIRFVFQDWLTTKLEKGEFIPGSKIKVIPGSLEGIQAGLDELKQNVSGIKLVVEL